MSLSEELKKKLNRIYEPSDTVHFHYRHNDITLLTDVNGQAVRAFIGKRKDDGHIKGDRYLRTIIKDKEGKLIKDYWERKGKAS